MRNESVCFRGIGISYLDLGLIIPGGGFLCCPIVADVRFHLDVLERRGLVVGVEGCEDGGPGSRCEGGGCEKQGRFSLWTGCSSASRSFQCQPASATPGRGRYLGLLKRVI